MIGGQTVTLAPLPQGWTEATLEQISDIIFGQSPPSSTYNERREGLPFYQGKLDFGEIYPIPRKWCVAPQKIVEKGDVLISIRAPVGPTNLCPEKSCIGRGLAAIRPLGGISSKFVLYLLRAHEMVIAGKGTGTTFSAITSPLLRKFSFWLPPLEEQKRIVSKIEELFTKLDAGIEYLKKARIELKRYRQSVLKAAFEGKLVPQDPISDEPAERLLARIKNLRKGGDESDIREKTDQILPSSWVWTELGNCVDVLDGKRVPINSREREIRRGNIPYYGATGQVGWIDDYIFDEELLLLGEDGAPFFDITKKKAYLISGKSWVNNHAHVLRAQKLLTSNQYLCYYLNSFRYGGFISGTTRPKLNQGPMKRIPVPLAPLNEQKRIVAEVERLLTIADASEKTIEESLGSAKVFRQSVLQSAFRGELVPQDPNDEPASKLLETIRRNKAEAFPNTTENN